MPRSQDQATEPDPDESCRLLADGAVEPGLDANQQAELDSFADELRGRFPVGSVSPEVAEYLHEPALETVVHHFQRLRLPAQSETCSLPTANFSRAAIPQQIGNYRLLRPLGRGGMGLVFLAEQQLLGVTRALKILSPELARWPDAVARFQNEFRASGRLDGSVHPAFARAHDAGCADGVFYLATEVVVGVDLDRLLIQAGPLPVGVAGEFIRQTALAMAQAHQLNLVHRDLKPSNLMVTADGTVKVLDLGLALLTNELSAAESATDSVGSIVGTLDFMAPEQLEKPEAVDQCCDIYSLGATLFALLTGESPLPTSRQASREEKAQALCHSGARRLQDVRPDLPASLIEFVDKMLSRDPAGRPQSAHEVAQRLKRWASPRAVRDYLRLVPVEASGDRWLNPAALRERFDQLARTRRRQRLGVIALLVGIVIVVAKSNWPSVATDPSPLSDSAKNSSRKILPTEPPREPALCEEAATIPRLEWDLQEFRALDQQVRVTEPPTLDEWLAGKKIVTVKQDGRGNYRTIFEACRGRQPGEVVEVLDVGPYVENLKIMPMPAGSGLFSRVGTVIIPAQWNGKKVLHKSVNREVLTYAMHSLAQCPDFRLSGFNFHWESIHNSRPFDMFTDGEFVIENCAFLQTGSTIHVDGNRPPLMWLHQTPTDSNRPNRIVVRDCVISSTLRVQLADPDPTELLVTRNLFRSADSAWRLWLFLDNTNAREHQIVVRQNVIHAKDFTTLVGPPMAPAQVVIDQNTLLSQAGYAALQINASEAEPNNTRMTVTRNVFFDPPNAWLTSSLKTAGSVRFNVVPTVHSDVESTFQCVIRVTPSLPAERPDYLRLSADSPVGRAVRAVGPDVVPGALALHEPGRPDDWFDRLRQRWVEQMRLNVEIADQLRAVPRHP